MRLYEKKLHVLSILLLTAGCQVIDKLIPQPTPLKTPSPLQTSRPNPTPSASPTPPVQTPSPTATASAPVSMPTPDPNYPRNEFGYITPINLNYPVEVVAGNGQAGYKDGQALQASFTQPQGLCADLTSGDIYITDGNLLRKLTPDGQVKTVAGSTEPGLKDGQGSEARFKGLSKCEVDQKGLVYLIDQEHTRLRMVSSQGLVSSIPDPYGPDASDMSFRTIAEFSDLAISPDNVLYFTNHFQIGRIQNGQFNILNKKQTSAARWQEGGKFSQGDIKSEVFFGQPLQITFTPDGNLFIIDYSYKMLGRKTLEDQVNQVYYNNSIPYSDRILTLLGFADNLIYDAVHSKLIATVNSVIVQADLEAREQILLNDAPGNTSSISQLDSDVTIGKDHQIYFIGTATHQIKHVIMSSSSE